MRSSRRGYRYWEMLYYQVRNTRLEIFFKAGFKAFTYCLVNENPIEAQYYGVCVRVLRGWFVFFVHVLRDGRSICMYVCMYVWCGRTDSRLSAQLSSPRLVYWTGLEQCFASICSKRATDTHAGSSLVFYNKQQGLRVLVGSDNARRLKVLEGEIKKGYV